MPDSRFVYVTDIRTTPQKLWQRYPMGKILAQDSHFRPTRRSLSVQ